MPFVYEALVVKHIYVKGTLLKLDLEPKGQGRSKQQNNKQGNKIFHLLINRARLCLLTVVQLMSQTGYE